MPDCRWSNAWTSSRSSNRTSISSKCWPRCGKTSKRVLLLQPLSTFIEKVVKLKRDVMSAMIYPAAVILLAIIAVAVIMIVVIPQFQSIFLGLLGPGEPLPLPTRIVVGFSNFLAVWGGLCILVVT